MAIQQILHSYGNAGPSIVLTTRTVQVGDTTGGVELRRDGSLWIRDSAGAQIQILGEWVASGASASVGDNYEVEFNNSGTWQRLSVTRQSNSTLPFAFLVRIRPFGGGSTLASATITVAE